MRCGLELREVKLAAKPPALIAASPKGTVPVLVLADGTVIDESLDIMRWALGQNDPEGWLAGDDSPNIPAAMKRTASPITAPKRLLCWRRWRNGWPMRRF